MLMDIYKSYVDCAKGLDGFVVGGKEDVPYDITELANGYVDAERRHDELAKSQYISALMVRYWHMVPKLYDMSFTTRNEIEDMSSWLYESFEKAFKYKSWLDPNKRISKDPKGAEKCFNQCITSTRQRWFHYYNGGPHKANICCTYVGYGFPVSLNSAAAVSSSGDTYDGDVPSQGVTMQDMIVSVSDEVDDVRWLISDEVRHGSLIDALILDGIAYGIRAKLSPIGFGPNAVAKYLKTLTVGALEEFSAAYSASPTELGKVADYFSSLDDARLKKLVSVEISRLKKSKKLRECLCS